MAQGFLHKCLLLGILCLLQPWAAYAAPFPPLAVEVTSEHPLLIFACPAAPNEAADAYAQRVLDAWLRLPPRLQPYGVMHIDAPPETDRHAYCRAALAPLQEAGAPVAVGLGPPEALYPPEQFEALLQAYSTVKGAVAADLPFNLYDAPGGPPLGPPPHADWLGEVVETAAGYGRFILLPQTELHWLRLMANEWSQPLYQLLREHHGYVFPANSYRDAQHVFPRLGGALGAWLEGAVAHWGVSCDSGWYADAAFAAPNVFGTEVLDAPLPNLYRGMILTGAMGGAAVYAFSEPRDLWFGERAQYWDEAIAPALEQIIRQGLISRQDFVREQTPVAYQMQAARSPEEFHYNLRDLDVVFDEGQMIQGVYGAEDAGHAAELSPNKSGLFWIPVLSPLAPAEALEAFPYIVRPGDMGGAAAWEELLRRYQRQDIAGTAYVARVGRGLFVFNTRENIVEHQTYTLPQAPAPVRTLVARRQERSVELSWGFREGDVSYSVHKRVLPALDFEPLAIGLDARRYVDQAVPDDQAVAYAVTALTNETEPLAGEVGYADYLVYSTVESRIAEEVILTPVLATAQSQPLVRSQEMLPEAEDWWNGLEGLGEKEQALAEEIAPRVHDLAQAVRARDLEAVMDCYSEGYEDASGWQQQYVRRAWQWYFERCRGIHMLTHIRRWDFAEYGSTGRARMLLYCNILGAAMSDSTGRLANPVLRLPRTEEQEIWVTWVHDGEQWRILHTDPALPNFRSILSYAAGPYDLYPLGPDTYDTE